VRFAVVTIAPPEFGHWRAFDEVGETLQSRAAGAGTRGSCGRLMRRLAACAVLAAAAAAVAFAAGDVALGALPPEAHATLAAIRAGGPFVDARDGRTFGNREGLLPARRRGYYREYTVPTPGAGNRGARRIVAGRAGEYYYTADHYRTFRRIRE
jgi:ribonuclease T1